MLLEIMHQDDALALLVELADRKKHRLSALDREGLEPFRGRARSRAMVECQQVFPVGEKVELLEVLEAESGSAGGVHFPRAADAEGIRPGACTVGGRRR